MKAMVNRRECMLQLVREKGEVSMTEFKKEFPNVSEMTIRRDIEFLDQNKLIVRVHGGAKSIESVVSYTEDRYTIRSIKNADLKKNIAQKAVKLIKPHTSIFLDSGTTTTALAQVFPDIECLACTSGLTCAIELARLKNVQIIMSGGRVNTNSLSTYGNYDMENLRNMNFDIAFLGATGCTEKAEFTTGIYEEGVLKRTVISRSQCCVMLMDSHKFGKAYPCTFAEMSDVDILISDEELNPAFAEQLRGKGVALM